MLASLLHDCNLYSLFVVLYCVFNFLCSSCHIHVGLSFIFTTGHILPIETTFSSIFIIEIIFNCEIFQVIFRLVIPMPVHFLISTFAKGKFKPMLDMQSSSFLSDTKIASIGTSLCLFMTTCFKGWTLIKIFSLNYPLSGFCSHNFSKLKNW